MQRLLELGPSCGQTQLAGGGAAAEEWVRFSDCRAGWQERSRKLKVAGKAERSRRDEGLLSGL